MEVTQRSTAPNETMTSEQQQNDNQDMLRNQARSQETSMVLKGFCDL